jgi:O-antigen ligase
MCLTAIVLTGSRGGLIATGAALLMLISIAPQLRHWQVRTLVLTAMTVLIAGIYLVPGAIWTRLSKLGTELLHGTMAQRTEIWAAGAEVSRNHVVLGVGLGAFGPAIHTTYGAPEVAHNTFLSIAAELGVVGVTIFFVLLGSLLACIARMRDLERSLWMSVLLTWTVGVIALSWDYRKPTWIVFALIVAHAWSRRYVVRRKVPEQAVSLAG